MQNPQEQSALNRKRPSPGERSAALKRNMARRKAGVTATKQQTPATKAEPKARA